MIIISKMSLIRGTEVLGCDSFSINLGAPLKATASIMFYNAHRDVQQPKAIQVG